MPLDTKWDQLKQMRELRDRPRDPQTGQYVRAAETPEPPAPPEQPEPEPQPEPEVPPVAAKAEPEPVKVPEPAPTVAKEPPAAPAADDGLEEVDLDGQKIRIDKTLAAAFRQAETVQQTAAAEADRQRLKDELRAELKVELAPPAKTDAQLAAEQAIRDAELAAKLPKKPDPGLMISDPTKYDEELNAYHEARVQAEVKKVRDEIAATSQRTAAQAAAAQEQQARGIVREQFYAKYPMLRQSEGIVDPIITQKFDEIVKSGRLATPFKDAKEQEAFKQEVFADISVRSTRTIVKAMNTARTIMPPAPPPPTLVASAPAKGARATPPEPEKPKEKYLKGTMSAALAEIRARKSA